MYPIPWYAIVLITIPQTILIIKLGCGLFNIDVNARQCTIASLIIGVFAYFIRNAPIMFGVHTVLLLFLLTILIMILRQIDFGRSFVSVLLGVMIIGVIEYAYLPFFLQITSTGVNDLANRSWLNIAGFLPEFIIALLIYVLMQRKGYILFDLKTSGVELIQSKRSIFIIAVILLQTFVLIMINGNLIVNQEYWNVDELIPWANIGLLFIAIFSILAIRQLEENTRTRLKIQLLKSHLQQVETLLSTLQAQKHEYTRHIQAIQSLVYLSRYQEAKQYIEGIAEGCWHTEDMLYTGHPVVTGLLNSKRSAAEAQGIEFAVAVKCDPAGIPVAPWDLCSILGNLLDNALEAAIQDKGKPRIAVEFKYEFRQYAIYIHNNGEGISPGDKGHIFEPGYTTKGSDARGYGLYLVKKLLDRYEGQIEILSKRQTCVIVRWVDKASGNHSELRQDQA